MKLQSDRKFQLIGLVGFIISGLFFFISGLQSGDRLTVLGSIIWIFSCIVWLIPFL